MLFPPFCTGGCACRTPARPRARLPPRRRFPAFWQCRAGSGRRKEPAALCPPPRAQWLCDLSGRRGAKPGGRFPARAAGSAGQGGFLALCRLDAEIPAVAALKNAGRGHAPSPRQAVKKPQEREREPRFFRTFIAPGSMYGKARRFLRREIPFP